MEQTLYEKGDIVDHIYFPKNGVISLVLTSEAGIDVEVGLIGHEGSLGAPETLGGHAMVTRAIVQCAGSGWRMSARVLHEQFVLGGALQTAILQSAYQQHQQHQQTMQCVLCNWLHPVEKRLARWMLMRHDRMQSNVLELTHEFTANILGTRRVGVTLAAGILREAELIEYSPGRVTIIDRPGLETRACECYAAIRASFDSLLPSNDPNSI